MKDKINSAGSADSGNVRSRRRTINKPGFEVEKGVKRFFFVLFRRKYKKSLYINIIQMKIFYSFSLISSCFLFFLPERKLGIRHARPDTHTKASQKTTAFFPEQTLSPWDETRLRRRQGSSTHGSFRQELERNDAMPCSSSELCCPCPCRRSGKRKILRNAVI